MGFGKRFMAATIVAGMGGSVFAESPELATPKLGVLAFVRAMEQDSPEAFAAVTLGAEPDRKLFVPLIHMVGAAKDGREAVEMFKKLRPDVVILDFSMPGMNGLEAAEQIFKLDKSLKKKGRSEIFYFPKAPIRSQSKAPERKSIGLFCRSPMKGF